MDKDAKKQLLRNIPYGLYAACTQGPKGEHHAFLLSWVTQASFDPPLLVACVNTRSTAHQHLTEANPHMAINLLTDDQKPLATNILQGVSFTEEQMGGQDYETGANGCAILPSSLGALEVTVVDQTTQGDHTVFVCEVTQAHRFEDGDPLTHKNTGWNYSG